jgi:hypothetical protein
VKLDGRGTCDFRARVLCSAGLQIAPIQSMEILAIVQSAYFVLTGIWPIMHIESFMRVTGPKRDLWLVKTVGVLVAVIGATIGLAGLRGRLTDETILLAVGSALGLATIDIVYVARKTISPIYLADAAVEAVIVVTWCILWLL